ncbi:hypothetical protein IPJ91_01405 [bacterium]|nr:MAG: hypothetical protein IPJ91_01405 [bacterium]
MSIQEKIENIKNFLPKSKIVPSILSDDSDFVEHELLRYMDYFDEIEFDVVTQDFTKIVNTKQFDTTLSINEYSEALLETELSSTIKPYFHLMSNNFLELLEAIDPIAFANAGFIVHLDSSIFSNSSWIQKFSRFDDWEIGIALNPDSDVEKLREIKTKWNEFWHGYGETRKLFDFVQVMTVEPGAQGKEFTPSQLRNIPTIKELFKEAIIKVDGGINLQNLTSLSNGELDAMKSVNVAIVGSYFQTN